MIKTLINWITQPGDTTTADVVRNTRGGYSIEITTGAKKTRLGNYPKRADAERVCRWNGYERKPHQ